MYRRGCFRHGRRLAQEESIARYGGALWMSHDTPRYTPYNDETQKRDAEKGRQALRSALCVL